MRYLVTVIFIGLAFCGRCDFVSFFEVKLNQASIYNSNTTTNQLVELSGDTIVDTDMLEIKYVECGMSSKNDYELHIKVENTLIDLTFINDEPMFTLNMGWLTQFKNKKASIYFYHTKYTGSSSQQLIHKVVDIFIA